METSLNTRKVTPDEAKRRRWKLEIIGGTALLGILTLLVIVINIATKKTPTQQAAPSSYPGIPESFTDFSGKVTAVTGNVLQAHFSEITSSGNVKQHEYAITITDSTKIQLSSGSPRTLTSAVLTDIRADENVIVSSDTNIADTNAFTAKTLTILR